MTYTNSITNIKEALFESVVDFTPELFKPYLDTEIVKYDAISAKAFYKFFKRMVCIAKAESVGKLKLTIEKTEETRKKHYCFYDEVHVHPRLNIDVIENEDSIRIEILPF